MKEYCMEMDRETFGHLVGLELLCCEILMLAIRNFLTKPNNSVLLRLNIAEPIREENKISAADPVPGAFTHLKRRNLFLESAYDKNNFFRSKSYFPPVAPSYPPS